MRYSLLSRFRGCLLGTIIGNASTDANQHRLAASWGKITVITAESLIKCGRFDLKDLHSALALATPTPYSQRNSRFPHLPIQQSLGAIMATLPLALFYHENEIKLRQNLLSIAEIWQDDPVSRDGALAVGYTTMQSLTEKLNSSTLIPQIVQLLGPSSQLRLKLAQVQTLLAQGAGLERAVTDLANDAQPSTAIALAFYCFVSTLEDLQLSIVRAARTRYQPQITAAIVGGLSGAYNSTAGIPANLKMALSKAEIKPVVAGEITTAVEMLELSDSLLAAWSGVYDHAVAPNKVMQVAAIAAPDVIRSG